MTLPQWIEENGVRMTSRRVKPTGWAAEQKGATSWRVTLRRGQRSMTTAYSMGSAHKGEPRAADVLSCLVSDAQAGEEYSDLFEFAHELGGDLNTRKGYDDNRRAFAACKRMAKRLPVWAGDAWASLVEAAQDY